MADADAVARRAAELLVETLGAALERRGRADVALTGGSTAAGLFQALAGPDFRDRLDWSRVHLWWGDERYVPTTHPASNAGQAFGELLGMAARTGEAGEGTASTDVLAGKAPGVAVPPANVHPFPVDAAIARGPGGAAWAAERYADELREALPRGTGGLPAFDLVLLGVGPDGHILSVFPESRLLDDEGPLARAVPAPGHVEPHLERITLHPRILEAAGRIVVIVTGPGKAAIVAEVFAPEPDPRRLPAQLARREQAVWLLDEAAAARLPPDLPVNRAS